MIPQRWSLTLDSGKREMDGTPSSGAAPEKTAGNASRISEKEESTGRHGLHDNGTSFHCHKKRLQRTTAHLAVCQAAVGWHASAVLYHSIVSGRETKREAGIRKR